jgi:hypothetical protein
MLPWVDTDPLRWGAVRTLAVEPRLGLGQSVRARSVLIVANVANGYGMMEDQFVAAVSALISCPVNKSSSKIICIAGCDGRVTIQTVSVESLFCGFADGELDNEKESQDGRHLSLQRAPIF